MPHEHKTVLHLRVGAELYETSCSCGYTVLASEADGSAAMARHQEWEIARLPLKDLMAMLNKLGEPRGTGE